MKHKTSFQKQHHIMFQIMTYISTLMAFTLNFVKYNYNNKVIWHRKLFISKFHKVTHTIPDFLVLKRPYKLYITISTRQNIYTI